MKLKACIRSMRLRTIPLSLSGVVMGTFIAATHQPLAAGTVVLLLTTTALLQIISNLSNELGDTLQGTDTADRQGIRYPLQDGDMTIPQMKRLIAIIVCCCALSGLSMIVCSCGTLFGVEPLLLVLLGAAAITAAMRYTLGKNPYGYRGWGDFYVFVFFGLVSVIGGYYINTHDLTNPLVLLPASAIGLFSIAVLNVNNIRDMKTDAANRTTVALKLGLHRARLYQTLLIAFGWLAMATYTALTATRWTAWLYLLTLPLYVKHLHGVWHRQDRELDPLLPLLVISTFAFTLLAGGGMLLCAR